MLTEGVAKTGKKGAIARCFSPRPWPVSMQTAVATATACSFTRPFGVCRTLALTSSSSSFFSLTTALSAALNVAYCRLPLCVVREPCPVLPPYAAYGADVCVLLLLGNTICLPRFTPSETCFIYSLCVSMTATPQSCRRALLVS